MSSATEIDGPFFTDLDGSRENRALSITVNLKRWDDLPSKGWFSGDNHIHYVRERRIDDDALLALAAAEDLHVANVLQAGHAGGVFFPQYNWSPVSSDKDSTYSDLSNRTRMMMASKTTSSAIPSAVSVKRWLITYIRRDSSSAWSPDRDIRWG